MRQPVRTVEVAETIRGDRLIDHWIDGDQWYCSGDDHLIGDHLIDDGHCFGGDRYRCGGDHCHCDGDHCYCGGDHCDHYLIDGDRWRTCGDHWNHLIDGDHYHCGGGHYCCRCGGDDHHWCYFRLLCGVLLTGVIRSDQMGSDFGCWMNFLPFFRDLSLETGRRWSTGSVCRLELF